MPGRVRGTMTGETADGIIATDVTERTNANQKKSAGGPIIKRTTTGKETEQVIPNTEN